MSLLNREIDENGYVIIKPLIEIDVDKKEDLKKYNRLYHREYYKKVLSAKTPCELCGSIVSKEKMKIHQKTMKCQRLRYVSSESSESYE